MKRELKFFIDLFIDQLKGLSNPEILSEVSKLSSGSYGLKVGENFAMLVVKSKIDGSYSFNYMNTVTKSSVTTVTATVEEIKAAFKGLLDK
jgi:hypothetical protein